MYTVMGLEQCKLRAMLEKAIGFELRVDRNVTDLKVVHMYSRMSGAPVLEVEYILNNGGLTPLRFKFISKDFITLGDKCKTKSVWIDIPYDYDAGAFRREDFMLMLEDITRQFIEFYNKE